MARGHTSKGAVAWRSSARDAPGVAQALERLGKRIRSLRIERNLTQAQAAELAKLDEKHWQDVERARTNPTVATLVGIARALNSSLAALFGQSTKLVAPESPTPAPRSKPSGRVSTRAPARAPGRASTRAPARASTRARRGRPSQ